MAGREACSGTGACSVSMNQMQAVTATFSLPWFPLNFTKAGTGYGAVLLTNVPSNFNAICEADCVRKYNNRMLQVYVLPYTAKGSVFSGWSGAGSGQGYCKITMNEAKNLTATFTKEDGTEQTLTYEMTGTGDGSVIFDPYGTLPDCDASCDVKYSKGTRMIAYAGPDPYSLFKGWSGACTSTEPTCAVTMSEARKITASFQRGAFLEYTRAGNGTGSVSFAPEGIFDKCDADCLNGYWPHTEVMLTATPADGSTFAGWS